MVHHSGARALVPKDAALYRLMRHFASACLEKSAPLRRNPDGGADNEAAIFHGTRHST
jgi:hypothetical protein